jgi:hypothetical protein
MERLRTGCAVLILLFVLVLVVGKCTRPSDEFDPEVERMKVERENSDPILPPTNEGFPIAAPSDPGAQYRILAIRRMRRGHLDVLSRRDGRSGTSFARREIDCDARTFRYLGEGDTREEAAQDGPNPGPMTEITGTSASSDVLRAACARGPM